jgi:large subunit ribosomal protein L24
MKIKKGDKVKVTTGKDRGREGVVERVYRTQDTLVIPGMNLYKKHMRKSQELPNGGIIDVPRPIPVSKVMLICPKCSKPTRVGYEIDKKKKYRVCRQCKARIN